MEDSLKILLVDDDAVARTALGRSLLIAGVKIRETVEVENCASAIAILEQAVFDCALINYQLPDGDALSLVRQIRHCEFAIALIVLTGQGDEQLAVELMKAGANDYLSNKLLPENLSRSLWSAVRVNRAEQRTAAATQKLRASEERYRLVLEGSNDGIWDWSICDDEVFCNDRMLEIVGRSRETLGTAQSAFFQLIHPDDQNRVLQAIRAHLHQSAPFDVEFRMQHGSGNYIDCTSRGKAQCNQEGQLFRMSGIVSDITQRKQAQEKIVQLNRDLEHRVTELQTLLDVIPIGIAIAEDAACQYIRVNASMSAQLGIALGENASKSRSDAEQLPFKIYQNGRELDAAELPMQRSAELGISISGVELEVMQQNGRSVTLLSEVAPLFDESFNSRGCVGAFLDITDRKRAEDSQRFLANASTLLTSSLDASTILENLAQLSVPYLADWCMIHTLQDEQTQLVALFHSDPQKVAAFEDYRQRYPLDLNSSDSIAVVLKTGQSQFYPQVSDHLLVNQTQNAEQYEQLKAFKFRSAMIVPLLARERILGVITFALVESNRHYTLTDLSLAEDLARRAALAVDNARLYQATQRAEQNLRKAIVILGEQQQQLRILQRLTDLLNQRLTDLPGLLQAMIDAICDAIPNAEFGLIVLQNPQTQQLELTATTGLDLDEFPINEAFSPGEGLLGRVFVTGKTHLIQPSSHPIAPDHDSLLTPHASLDHLPSSLCAVAIESAQAGRLGVLAIGNWEGNTAFDEDDSRMLVAFGEQAAIALNNAQLINALEEREERLEMQNAILAQQNQALENQRQQIQSQNLRLIEAAQLKSQFLATMSHELRTPMNAIMGFSQLLLRQSQLRPVHLEMVDRILNNAKNLLALINDILDLSKIEAGRLELKLERFNLSDFLTATTSELRSLADQKQLLLSVNSHLKDPWVVNDSARLRQVLVNLLSNAIKFTDVGTIEVEVWGLANGRLVISVRDTGIGIAPDDLVRIFEEFRQLDQSSTRRHGGTGLGLAITKWLVQMMGGTIGVESQLAAGSTFRVELPRWVERRMD
ncbi:PAS domain S-box protein [Phormidesmis priestleyi ULC007]|uniref:Circadian input-output histidine kinase CikA n=1 Tax=Phormidesmis priestleyi ULC007 TaxID=1920490 RepID=A0A2T1DBM9_9CYAN|nr:PAS domain S-box protein [Phormidesmis priestleyi ULC007]PZO45889.1 MAG: PAS domain S-box protein [Phormidesmis priestleyi]